MNQVPELQLSKPNQGGSLIEQQTSVRRLSNLTRHEADIYQTDTIKLYTKAHGAKVGPTLRVRTFYAEG